MDIEGRIQYARGWGVVPEHLAKLLRHHRLRCGGADRIAVRGGNLDRAGTGARVVAGGMIYVVIVLRRARRQTDYQPVLEDWLWHTVFPLVSYTALLVAAILLPGHPAPALFVIAAATVLLLFIGIHNAWDNVIYITFELSRSQNKSQD
ncbi:MAG: hypothetical protein AUH94_08935 [Ktedonobacter sp. 13_2_20CM_2_54_8]|nr:MAG: hypothetical protein AUH94_08935 [Ktedonobacter sp. 13_2_20CM_2_54_8]